MLTSSKLREQKGAALVEFAFAVPLLLFLLFGFIEFGVLFYNKQVITNASREGTRAAINPVPKLSTTQVVDIVQDYCDSRLIYFGTLNPITVTPPDPNRDFEDNVTIYVTWQYDFLMPSIIKLGASIPIGAETTMKMM